MMERITTNPNHALVPVYRVTHVDDKTMDLTSYSPTAAEVVRQTIVSFGEQLRFLEAQKGVLPEHVYRVVDRMQAEVKLCLEMLDKP